MDLSSRAIGLRAVWSAIPMWWRSYAYLKKHGLRRHHLSGPAVIVVLTLIGWWFADQLTETLQARIHNWMDPWLAASEPKASSNSSWWSWPTEWMLGAADTLAEWAAFLTILWLKVKVIKYLLITIMAPFMSLIAADVIRTETGRTSAWSALALLRDLVRGLRISCVLLFMEVCLGILLWGAGLGVSLLFPPLGVLLSPLFIAISWVVGSYFFGAAVFDAVYEQWGLSWRTSLRAGWQARGHLIGIGMVFSTFMAIPFIGPYVAALLGPVPCTTAAARLYLAGAARTAAPSDRLNPPAP